MEGKAVKITDLDGVYSGGGVWTFFGKADGTDFMTFDEGWTLLLDTSGLSDIENAFDPDWQDKHTVKELEGPERNAHLKALLRKMKSICDMTSYEIQRRRERWTAEYGFRV
jgi:hypothetical protein